MDQIIASDERKADREFQREMAKHGVRWRVEDAKSAGIHPLDALGMHPVSGQTSYVGDSNFSAIGQDVSRAAQAGSTEMERQQIKMNEINITRGELENQLLASQVARSKAPHVPPPKPGISIKDSTPVAAIAGKFGELGIHPEVTFGAGAGGTIIPYPSPQFQDYLSESFIPNVMWMLRNNVLPSGIGPPQEIANQQGLTPGDYEWIPGLGWSPVGKLKDFGYRR